MTRRTLLQTAAGAALAGAAPSKPNVLLILADDLGYGDLAGFGAGDMRTPNIDGIVREGIRFTRFYSNSPVCSPTRAALLSGRYPDIAGVPGVIRTHPENSWGRLSPEVELLPATLKRAGYHTALVGKWHLGLTVPNLPHLRGFDHFHGFLGDMMDDYRNHRRHEVNYMRLNDHEIDPQGHATDLFTGWATEYLDSRRNQTNPFFLYLAYNAPHVPVQPPPEFLERVRSREPGIDPKRAALVALIEHMDAGVGKVLDALRANQQIGNTLVIFVSDNGGQLSAGANCGPLRSGKGDMYEGGIRVPMCAMWPGRIPKGATSDRVGLTMDLNATIREAAGVPQAIGMDGVSILPELTGARVRPDDRHLVWVRREGGPPYYGRDYYAVRRGQWKLLQNSPFQAYELYNLDDDPKEARNLANSEPVIFRQLAAALSAHVQRAGRVPWQA